MAGPAKTTEGGAVILPRPAPPASRPLSRIGAIGDSRFFKLISRRLGTSIVLLFVVSALSFLLISLTPGDEARAIVGLSGTHAHYLQVREELGLDESLPAQYWHWLTSALSGDFGQSLTTSQPVTAAIESRIGVTLSLIIVSMIVSVFLGVLFGVASAVIGGAMGRFVDALALVGFAVPQFWLGAIFISFFAVKLGLFPSTGYVTLEQSIGGWLESIVLPVAALAAGGVAAVAKQARDGMLEELGSEHVRAARACGISPASVIFRHALRGSALRVIAVSGWLAISLLGGTIFVESVFALPGLGSLAVEAATQHDIPLILGVAVTFTLFVIVVNLITDVLSIWLDPRVRVG